MCLIAFAIDASPRWPLVIAANRDEFLDRPTLPLSRWTSPSGQEIISGRDQRAGGAWMGMTAGGRVAFLTNVRSAQPETAARSRGELVMRWLEHGTAQMTPDAFAAALQSEAGAYAGFNLVVGDVRRHQWQWMSNKGMTGWASQALGAGVYGLSNAALDTAWPKTTELKRALADALVSSSRDADSLTAPLWAALDNRQRAALELLPSTGVPTALEEALSSAFVNYTEHGYGTRSSTVVLAGAEPAHEETSLDWIAEERTHTGDMTGKAIFRWQTPATEQFTVL